MKNRSCGIILIIISLFIIPIAVSAQTGSTARLSAPAIESFPQIEAYFDIRDTQGDFIHGLQTNHIEIIENWKALPVSSLEEIRSGVQVVVALNPGASFGIRNSQAISRYDYVKEALRSWAKSRQGSTIDDWSLLITEGPAISHVSDPTEWLKTLALDQVDARTATPQFDTLFQAITLASDTTSSPGMGRAILFVTPPLEGQDVQSLENLLAQAEQERIPIFIWMVSSAGTYSAQSLEFLEQISNQTGGEFFIFTGEEPLPNPEEYLEPLRYSYFFSYQSKVKRSGSHEVSVRITFNGERIESNSQKFDLNILPPQPAFITPPLKIQRDLNSPNETNEEEKQTENDYEPKDYNLQVIFDFPDGRKRDLIQSSLLVDGIVIYENTEPPFDQFTWDISEYTSNSTSNLQVQATDILGLTGTSIEIPVQISVEQLKNNPWAILQNKIPIIIALIIFIAGAILFLMLITGRKLGPSTLRISLRHHNDLQPAIQSIQMQSGSTSKRFPEWASQVNWSQTRISSQADAILVPLSNSETSTSLVPIPITSDIVNIGSDPEQSTISLQDPSIDSKHASIRRNKEDFYQIIDQGSTAGTWVNYIPIKKDGVKLEHGDQVHIGRIGFIFTLRDPIHIRKPIITPPLPPDETKENLS